MPERCKKSAKSRKTWQFLRGAFSAIPPRRDNRGENVLQDKARTFQLTVSILPPVQDKKKTEKEIVRIPLDARLDTFCYLEHLWMIEC